MARSAQFAEVAEDLVRARTGVLHQPARRLSRLLSPRQRLRLPARARQRDETIGIEFHTLRLDQGPLQPGVVRLLDIDLGTARVFLAHHALPRQLVWTAAHGARCDAVARRNAGQLSDLTRNEIAPLIKNLSQHVDSIASVIDKNTPELLEQSKQLLHRLNSASDALNDVLKPENRAAIASTLGNTRELSKELIATQDRLRSALEQIDNMIRENRPGVRDAVTDLRSTLAALSSRMDSISQHLAIASRNFEEFSNEIRKHPNSLLLAPKADKLEVEDK